MAIYDNFPYTDIHELNLGWIINRIQSGLTKTDIKSTDLDDYHNLSAMLTVYRCKRAVTNAPTGLSGNSAIVVYLGVLDTETGLQFAWFDQVNNNIYYRILVNDTWQPWYVLNKTSV